MSHPHKDERFMPLLLKRIQERERRTIRERLEALGLEEPDATLQRSFAGIMREIAAGLKAGPTGACILCNDAPDDGRMCDDCRGYMSRLAHNLMPLLPAERRAHWTWTFGQAEREAD